MQSIATEIEIAGERFTGVPVPLLMSAAMRSSTERGLVAMNDALKSRAETTEP